MIGPILALVRRDLIKFRRMPIIAFMSVAMPVAQLLVMGNAIGGKFRNIPAAVVDEDKGEAAIEVRSQLQAMLAGGHEVEPVFYPDRASAVEALRTGRVRGVLIIPPHYSRDLAMGAPAELGFVVDNTDNFSAAAMDLVVSRLVAARGKSREPPAVEASTGAAKVNLYPYFEYVQYLLPGTIVMSIFISAMIGGGIIFIDDKSRGIHEGYLVTPLTKFQILVGFTLSGTVKAIFSGVFVGICGALASKTYSLFDARIFFPFVLTCGITSLCLIGFMFLLMARISNPLVPRALFGILNVILFFPSGAVYPIESFPAWLRAISVVNPETYAVHAMKSLLLRETGFGPIAFDLAYLSVFTAVVLFLATLVFKRKL
ncbi:MAG: ABC transporter permease [Planctomycetes bacterium]|nr:ABC transporter permease [Planctomycetota bacterium]MBI3846226.1 ABC transporter permease [Planctomycetota bacterium]